jgi:hypothetical protein
MLVYVDKDGFEHDGLCVPIKEVATTNLVAYLFEMVGEGFKDNGCYDELVAATYGDWKFVTVGTVLALEGELENQLYDVENFCEAGWDDYDHLRVSVYTRMIKSGIKKVQRTIRKFQESA